MRQLAVFFLLAALCRAADAPIDLSGEWRFRLDPQDRGHDARWWESRLPDRLRLPGSLQEQGFGDDVTAETKWVANMGVVRKQYPDWRTHPMFEKYRQPGAVRFPYWLQPAKHYVGRAWFQREIEIPAAWSGRRITLSLERCHWKTRAWLDGLALGENDSLGAPHVYHLPGAAPGRHTLTILVDNRMIHPVGLNAHSVSDQTQTAWNGVAGRIELRASAALWIEEVQVYPDVARNRARVRVAIGNATGRAQAGAVRVAIAAYNTRQPHAPPPQSARASIAAEGVSTLELDYPLGAGAQRWDEFSPALYRAQVRLEAGSVVAEAATSFGLREIRAHGTGLELNGRRLFLRGSLECAIFPLTGYPPTDLESWRRILRIAKSYGLNHLRFHSWFPPEAAFTAADEEGVYLQPECHVWGPVRTPALHAWLAAESARLLRRYGNHASFVMFGLGNESFAEKPIMTALMAEWKGDPRRVYTGLANANASIIPEYDFYIGREFQKKRFRYQSGWPPLPENVWFLDRPPQTMLDFREPVELYGKPVLSHETVQRCSYPDLAQASRYKGSLKAAYLEIARDQLAERGMLHQASDFVRASGRWQAAQFKEEIEAALRTPGLAGFQLLSLHDFPGQGAALVGVLDAFWESKGYIAPEEFRRFSGATVPLARMAKRTWTTGETFTAAIEVAHFGAGPLGTAAEYGIRDAAGKTVAAGRLPAVPVASGRLAALGAVNQALARFEAPAKYNLRVRAGGAENDWDFWVYPRRLEEAAPGAVVLAKELDEALARRLEAGALVLLAPPRERIRGNLQQCFTSIYWDAPWTNGGESETLGILTDPKHPLFRRFPTDFHSNWQWFELLSGARPFTLDGWGVGNAWPKSYQPQIQLIDDWNQNRKLAVLAEARVGGGRIVLCSLDLESGLEQRVVARQLRTSLLAYMESPAFQPAAQVSVAQVRALLQ